MFHRLQAAADGVSIVIADRVMSFWFWPPRWLQASACGFLRHGLGFSHLQRKVTTLFDSHDSPLLLNTSISPTASWIASSFHVT